MNCHTEVPKWSLTHFHVDFIFFPWKHIKVHYRNHDISPLQYFKTKRNFLKIGEFLIYPSYHDHS